MRYENNNVRNILKKSNSDDVRLINEIRKILGDIECAYILDWIPEQGLDIYTVVVPPRIVVILELHEQGSSESETMSLNEFKRLHRKLPVMQRRKLALIENLLTNHK